MRVRTSVIVLFALTIWSGLASGQQTDDNKIESPSPDGRFAFRYRTEAPAKSDAQADDEARPKRTYELIEKKSGKVLKTVAESDPEGGPSSRFNIVGVRWRADSSAFAITGYLWKRGSFVSVFVRDGATFREIELPELGAEPY